MTVPIRQPQSPPRFFLDAPKQPKGECYVLNRDYMELDQYCMHLLAHVKGLEAELRMVAAAGGHAYRELADRTSS